MNNNKARRTSWHYALAASAVLGIAALTMPSLVAAERTFAPDDQFSILFASKVTTNKANAGNVITQTWNGREDDIYYGASQSSSSVPFDAPKELATNFTNFIAEVHATVIKEEHRTWPAPPGPVPALRFELKLPKGQRGKGVFVVRGDTVFGAVAVDYTSPARDARLSAVVDSLRLLK